MAFGNSSVDVRKPTTNLFFIVTRKKRKLLYKAFSQYLRRHQGDFIKQWFRQRLPFVSYILWNPSETDSCCVSRYFDSLKTFFSVEHALSSNQKTKHHSLTNRITRSALISVLRLMQQNRGAAELSQIFFLLPLFAHQISLFACSASDRAHCGMVSLSDMLFFFFCCLCPSKSNSKARCWPEPLSYSPGTPSRIDVF